MPWMSPEEILAAGEKGLAGQDAGWFMRAWGTVLYYVLQLAAKIPPAPTAVSGVCVASPGNAPVDISGATRVQRIEFTNTSGAVIAIAAETTDGSLRYGTTTLKANENSHIGAFALGAGLRLRVLSGTSAAAAGTFWTVYKS